LPVCVWIVVPPARHVLKLPAMFSRTIAAPEPPSWISWKFPGPTCDCPPGVDFLSTWGEFIW
jgi:hypothetical protein